MIERKVCIPEHPLVVGSVSSLNQLACLQPVEVPELCDVLEIRIDGMAEHFESLREELERFVDVPLLMTVRAKDEGGMADLNHEERSKLLLAVAAYATWIDVELASYAAMQSAIHEIRTRGVGLILSYHNFERTPPTYELQRILNLAEESDIAKLALMHHSTDDFTRCVNLLENNNHPLSLMGMGRLGAVSRVLYSQHGSLLNYGYLGSAPTAPGQWPAPLLKQVLNTTRTLPAPEAL